MKPNIQSFWLSLNICNIVVPSRQEGRYFFTVVTHNRRAILCEPENIELLRNSFRWVKQKHPFVIDASLGME